MAVSVVATELASSPSPLNETDRFTRSRWLFNEDFEKLQNASVLVCGCGGVGGVVIDALYRAGVGQIEAIDCDKFDITNQNRQLLSHFIGEDKAAVFAREYGIKTSHISLTPKIIESMDFSRFDIVVDAIDDIKAKVALAHKTHKKIICSLGAARRIDPQKIKIASIFKTSGDPFARKIRYELRKSGFKGDFECVYSIEPPKCQNLGSFIGVTAAFGLNIASLVVQKIIGK